MNTQLIGLTAPSGAGKNYIANTFQKVLRNNNSEAAITSFSEPIRQLCLKLFENNTNTHQAMQEIGRWGRHYFGEDVWLKCTKRTIDNIDVHELANLIIISDVRFDREAIMIKNSQGKIININNSEVTWTNEDIGDSGISPHLIDMNIHYNPNHFNQDYLFKQIKQILTNLQLLDYAPEEEYNNVALSF